MLMKEEGMQETPNKLIHIGKPIEFNEDEFYDKLHALDIASRSEKLDVHRWVRELVPTYKYTPGTYIPGETHIDMDSAPGLGEEREDADMKVYAIKRNDE